MQDDSNQARSSDTASGAARKGGRTYVLIHGAWHGGWVWHKVADGLRALGHRVYAPSLTGLGDRKHLLRPGINLDTHCDDIVNLVEMEGLDQIVLVGWSYGGMIAADVLARITDKVASIVYLDAFAPDNGRTLLSYSEKASPIHDAIQLAVQGRDLPPLPFAWMGVTDQAVIDYATPRVSDHPVLTYLQKSKALPQRPDIPHTYVLAAGSPIVVFKQFHKMFEQMPGADTHVLNVDHLLMLTSPEATVEILAHVK